MKTFASVPAYFMFDVTVLIVYILSELLLCRLCGILLSIGSGWVIIGCGWVIIGCGWVIIGCGWVIIGCDWCCF